MYKVLIYGLLSVPIDHQPQSNIVISAFFNHLMLLMLLIQLDKMIYILEMIESLINKMFIKYMKQI